MEEEAMGEAEGFSKSREAWSQVGDEFADIAQRFRQAFESVAQATKAEADPSVSSIERAVRKVGDAVSSLADSLNESLHDAQVRQDADAAGSALMRAFGTTMSELGDALQRGVDEIRKPD
jgi:prophage DNA circulation protein